MILKEQLGNNIQKLRKINKITQEKLAELVGIDPKSISRIESGNTYPSAETLTAIAGALNIEIYELFAFNEIPYEQMKNEIISELDDRKKIIYLYRQLKGV